MKEFAGCLVSLIVLSAGAWIAYMLFHVILFFLPFLFVCALILSIPCGIYHAVKGKK